MSTVAFIAVDWGTTSFRLWAIDQAGIVVANRQGGSGMSTLKSADFEAVLEEKLCAIGVGSSIPVVVCGMAGAAQGWIEAPYVQTPFELSGLPQHAIQVPGIERDVRILPGLAQYDDNDPEVMRGEETQLLGALRMYGLGGTYCLPGTHSKWAWLEAGTVTHFSTAMTGEIFGLLAHHSTLAPYIESVQGALEQSSAFEHAVKQAIAAPETVLRQLFSIRAIPLLKGKTRVTDMSSRLSGLLIGLEIAGMHKSRGHKLALIAGGQLSHKYARAFDIADLDCTVLDAEAVTQHGLMEAARTIWPGILKERDTAAATSVIS